MSLPYSYKQKIETPENHNFKTIVKKINLISSKIGARNMEQTNNEFSFTLKRSLFAFNFNVSIKKTDNGLFYEFQLMELIKIILIIVVFIAFISKFSLNGFLWFSALFILVFYVVNVIYINQKMKQLFDEDIFETIEKQTNKAEMFSLEQKKWLTDPNKCSACGEYINEYDKSCPECGLKFKGRHKIAPINITKFEDYHIKYNIVKKQKNKNLET